MMHIFTIISTMLFAFSLNGRAVVVVVVVPLYVARSDERTLLLFSRRRNVIVRVYDL